jgi:acyl-CoA thioesterase
MRDAAEIAQRSADTLWAESAAWRDLGMELLEIGAGHARMAMTITDRMSNGFGSCHGGFIFTLADAALTFAAHSHGRRATGEHCTVTYVAPGRLGMRLVAEARERSRSERSGIYEVVVRDEAGALIAEFRGHARAVAGSLVDIEAG